MESKLPRMDGKQRIHSATSSRPQNEVAVLDRDGTIVAVNAPWLNFGVINNGDGGFGVGANYLELCRKLAHRGSADAQVALNGIEAVCGGSSDYFEMEYQCHTGNVQPWYVMSVTPLRNIQGSVVVSHRNIDDLKRGEQAVRSLSGRLIHAQEEERSRIARDLHDDINQRLALLAIELQQLNEDMPELQDRGRLRLQELWQQTNELSMDVHRISHQLHSSKLEHLGLAAAIRGACKEFEEQCKAEVYYACGEIPANLDHEFALSLFRVLQESLRNVVKHSKATKVKVELVDISHKLVLRISDDGVGFEPQKMQLRANGLGLVSMRERMRLIGGDLAIWSRPSLGTQIEASVRLAGSNIVSIDAIPNPASQICEQNYGTISSGPGVDRRRSRASGRGV